MPTFKNVSPLGDVELVLQQAEGVTGRTVAVTHGDTFEVTDAEAVQFQDQVVHYQLVGKQPAVESKEDGASE